MIRNKCILTVLSKMNKSEFRRTNCELPFQMKKGINLGASIVLTSAKFRKLGDESKRNFIFTKRLSKILS